jgi:transcriptional regulator with XRE-family HTH domain
VKQFPNRLREFREAEGLSLQEMAARTNKAFQTISEYERGLQQMPEDFLMKAEKVLQRTAEEILESPSVLNEVGRPAVQ